MVCVRSMCLDFKLHMRCELTKVVTSFGNEVVYLKLLRAYVTNALLNPMFSPNNVAQSL